MQKRELFFQNCLKVREHGFADDKMIDANAIVTGVETILYEDEYERQIEVIEPSCVRQEFLDKQNALINIFHEYITSFARSSKFGGTALILERDGQVNFKVSAEESVISRHARDLIANGTINGCSFEFWPKDYEIENREGCDGKKEIVIRHREFAAIDALTLAARPAYPTTSVNLREIYQITDDGDPDCENKRECKKEDECNKDECNKDECEKIEDEQIETTQEECDKHEAEKEERDRKLRDLENDWEAEEALDARSQIV